MKKILVLLCLFATGLLSAQELNCNVSMITSQVQGTQTDIYDQMESTIQDFMNSRKWTEDDFALEERIDVNMQITITEQIGLSQFKGTIQIQSSRPVYNSDYNSPMFAINDDFEVTFFANTAIQFSLDQHRDNLSSLLAYYAYMVIATDYDSFSPEGGTDYYLKAQTIVTNAQKAPEKGWRASESQDNRFWLVENILSQSFRPLRTALYDYHRNGFDILYSNVDEGRAAIAQSLIGLRKIHQIRPASYNLKMFFFSKNDEIINLFKESPDEERLQVYNVLTLIDPGNIQKYEQLRG